MNDFFENGIISEIDDEVINYLKEINEPLSNIYMAGITSCSNKKEQELFSAHFFKINNYLLTNLPENIKNYFLALSLG
jgi:hypothetical protein